MPKCWREHHAQNRWDVGEEEAIPKSKVDWEGMDVRLRRVGETQENATQAVFGMELEKGARKDQGCVAL